MFRFQVAIILILIHVNSGFAQYPDSIRLNDIRILASHNSYKKKPDEKVIRFLTKFKRRLGENLNPSKLNYGHVPLTEQFDRYEIRGIELDLYCDPKGGRFEKRRINRFIRGMRQHSCDSVMMKPGLKVLHIADVDYESNYRTFGECLSEIKRWSKSNPKHIPLFINLEPKNAAPGDYSRFLRLLGFRKAHRFDSLAMNEIDTEIQNYFGEEHLFTPSLLRDTFETIGHRLAKQGWPRLNDMLGKVIFILDGYGELYEQNSTKHIAFSYGNPENAETAFVIRNNPVGNETAIRKLSESYIVRTRTDAETEEAMHNDYTRFNAALNSGAQVLSTDYYGADQQLTTYHISLEPYKANTHWEFLLQE